MGKYQVQVTEKHSRFFDTKDEAWQYAMAQVRQKRGAGVDAQVTVPWDQNERFYRTWEATDPSGTVHTVEVLPGTAVEA